MSASEFYQTGEVIYSGEPFVHIVYKEHQGRICDECLQPGNSLKKCNACKFVSYCNKLCQKKAWRDHKYECPHLKNLPEERDDFIRLLGKVIFKLQNKNWNECVDDIGNISRSFDDLISHSERYKNDARCRLHGSEVAYLLEQYIGKSNLPEYDRFIEILGKVKFNRFCISNEVSSIGSGLYIGGSIFDHSCIPNAIRLFNGKKMQIKAISKIAKGDIRKVTISYGPVLSISNELEEILRESFKCECIDCSLPYGESVLTKVVDERKAYSAIELTEAALAKIRSIYKEEVPLPPRLVEPLKTLLKLQDGVLGETHILRLKLLWVLADQGSPQEKKRTLKLLIDAVKLAFGENSDCLIMLYMKMTMVNSDPGYVVTLLNEITRLKKLHFGN